MFIETNVALRLVSHYFKSNSVGLIKEPKDIDLSTKSEPWTEQELADFRKVMQDIKAKSIKQKEKALRHKEDRKQHA